MKFTYYNQWKEWDKEKIINIFDLFTLIFVKESSDYIFSLSILGFVFSLTINRS